MYLSPVLIEPLFFKFKPLQKEELAERVKVVMWQAGLQVDRVQQVDASRRSKHSNAYFTGIGRVKRIVLFDTLLEQMTDDEIVSDFPDLTFEDLKACLAFAAARERRLSSPAA